MSKKSRINISELTGLLNLLTDATISVTDLVEAMNRRIVHPPFLPSTSIQHLITGISGIVYSGVRKTTRFVGFGMEQTLVKLNPYFNFGFSIEKKEILLAILNGVIGDHLEESNNPLAIPMQLIYQRERLNLDADSNSKDYPNMNGKIILMVHGLCTDDIQWNHKDHNHGEFLADELNLTPLYLNYNSGLHISTNGQKFNSILEELINTWPVPIEEITIVAHSMGGLVSRSAFHYGMKEKNSWTKYLKKMIFLGTPHFGSPLERIGNHIDHLLEIIPYVKPIARLAKIRSSGITDLRFGSLVDEDWEGKDRFENDPNGNTHIPLPKHVNCYAIAACLGKEKNKLKLKILGDGLVPLNSALGKHKKEDKDLNFKKSNTFIVYDTNHVDLLNSIEVYNKLKTWLLK